MGSTAFLLPYVLVAVALAGLAALRAWEVFDAKMDLLLAVCLAFVAAAVAGAADFGTDAPIYREYYSNLVLSGPQFQWWEPGFSALAWLFASSNVPYGVFAFCCVLASHLIKLHVFNQLLFNRLLAFFIVYCLSVGEVGFVRQYLAASLILLAYYQLSRRNVATAVLSILLAVMIHKTALLAGIVVVLVSYGGRSFKPLFILSMLSLVVLLIAPDDLKQAVIARVEGQFASYAVQEYVQGLGSSEIALFKNVAKFFAYLLFAAWMLLLPAASKVERAQKATAKIVVALSLISIVLIAAISPVFARISTFVFPFFALCTRDARFRPYVSQIAGQYAASLLLIMNLAVALYPLADYF